MAANKSVNVRGRTPIVGRMLHTLSKTAKPLTNGCALVLLKTIQKASTINTVKMKISVLKPARE